MNGAGEATVRNPILAKRWVGWLPLLILPAAALGLKSSLPAWAFMWLLAGALFLGCKWQTFWDTATERKPAGLALSLAYLFGWPGMDATAFLDASKTVSPPPGRAWLWALGKILFGAALFWGTARMVAQQSLPLGGWSGMVGLIFLLHFGSFHLLALLWQSTGVNAQPIMQAPHRAESLSEFWGKRWNLGFRHLTHTLVFAPLKRRIGLPAATLGAFLVSGLIHDLVISLPAGAGYGLPTAYFLTQGFGALAERSASGRRLGLGHGLRGRLFVVAVAALPLPLLFHLPFVHDVIVPFLQAAGAL